MPHHIILIDNDESLRMTATLLLEDAGYRVSSFAMLTTVEEFAGLRPDLFVIDERLPSVSGHIVSIMLRSNPAIKGVPQILISASPLLDKLAALGEVNATLRKPFDVADLLGAITAC